MEGLDALARHLDCSYNQGGNSVGVTHLGCQQQHLSEGW